MRQVLGLLGFSFVFTALGAWLGVNLGPGAFVPALLASFGALLALFFLHERSPLNLALLYTFVTGEGITLGLALFWDHRALWWGCTWARYAGPGLRPGIEIHVCVVPTLMLRARVGWPYRRK
jgi:FtsH-binding integral membrane protein